MYVVKVHAHGGNEQSVEKYDLLDNALTALAEEVRSLPPEMHRNIQLLDGGLVVEGIVGTFVMTDIALYEEP